MHIVHSQLSEDSVKNERFSAVSLDFIKSQSLNLKCRVIRIICILYRIIWYYTVFENIISFDPVKMHLTIPTLHYKMSTRLSHCLARKCLDKFSNLRFHLLA